VTAAVLRQNLAIAGHDFVRSLERKHVVIASVWLAVAALPLVLRSSTPTRALAWLIYFAVAVAGLNFVMGLGNMSSIGHGAFMAIGALLTTLMRTRLSMGFLTSVVIGTAATAAAAFIVAHGAIRLRAIQLAISSWLGAWLIALFLTSFPSISGGASGLVLPDATIGSAFGFEWRVTAAMHYVIALALLAIALLLFRSLAGSSAGLLLATIKQNPKEAAVIGTLRDSMRLKLFVFGSTVAGLVGALGVHLTGIFDHRSFGVLLSVSLFLAVLVGRPARIFAPVLGALVIAVLPLEGQPLIPFLSTASRPGEVLAGVLLLGILLLGAPSEARPVSKRPRAIESTKRPPRPALEPTHLFVDDVSKSYGGLLAVDRVGLEVRGGEIHGIMGPNGSGKSTLLALISGHVFADSGGIALDGNDVTRLPAETRLRLGIARSLQSTELFPDLTALEHFEAAGLVDRRYDGFLRATLRTPLARSEETAARRVALAQLEGLGLAGYKDTPAAHIPAGARRLLTVGMTTLSRRVVLLDEPSAGMSSAEVLRAAGIITELKRQGAAVLVVEHNVRLLKRVADTITVLDGGRVIARGTPADVYDDPEVRRAYLGLENERSG
jgi:ABC-type branched-subunit amino acid transport system ATPase component/ABC-type branched-subunit amino acid transport system permease subunit